MDFTQYGAKVQYAETDDCRLLSPAERKPIQQLIGVLLFYARAVDCSLLVALSTLAAAQSKGTEATAAACTQLLNYCATHPDATVRFHASDMVLHVSSDASYLSESQGRSRAGGCFFLSSHPAPSPDAAPPPINGPIHVVSTIMPHVLSSAAESELGALFINGKEACPFREALTTLGHPQPPTPIQCDNTTAAGIANDTVKQKRSKAFDMRFYWIRDRVAQGQFCVYWQPGILNHADYFTKHHPASHHQAIRSTYLHQ